MNINETIPTIMHKFGYIEIQASIIKYIQSTSKLMHYMDYFSNETLLECIFNINDDDKLFLINILPIANRQVRESLDSCLILVKRIKGKGANKC